jgi:hypothetical protein
MVKLFQKKSNNNIEDMRVGDYAIFLIAIFFSKNKG